MINRESITIILGVCGILLLAVGLPLGIYFNFRRSRGPSTGEVLTRAGKGARQPWSDEDEALAKLSKEVGRLKHVAEQQPDDSTRSDDTKNKDS